MFCAAYSIAYTVPHATLPYSPTRCCRALSHPLSTLPPASRTSVREARSPTHHHPPRGRSDAESDGEGEGFVMPPPPPKSLMKIKSLKDASYLLENGV